MRGAQHDFEVDAAKPGITPAYAGSTARCRSGEPARRDHPRVCGEHRHANGAGVPPQGSSPRMRGALRLRRAHAHAHGIIPAYAGSTSIVVSATSSRWDHPRVCGEHMSASATARALAGSSPRMRGAPAQSNGNALTGGIIPAYAGSTEHRRVALPNHWDHPRVCGEHRLWQSLAGFGAGSSPRMRGARRIGTLTDLNDGIIPAYAGSTFTSSRPTTAAGDHPRVCGEHLRKNSASAWGSGSSPRMRGAL